MTELLCPACGHRNDLAARFCRKCGHALVPVPEPTTTPLRHREAPSRPRGRSRRAAIVLGMILLAVAGAVLAWRIVQVRRTDSVAVSQREERLRQSEALGTEKDSLLSELLETTTLLSDINQAVTAVQNGRNAPMLAESSGRPMTAREARAILLPKIDSLRARLDAAQSRIGSSLDRVHQISGTETQLRAQIVEYERTVASVRKLLASQQQQVATLGTEVETLRAENQKLLAAQGQFTAVQSALQDSVLGLKESQNTVYWVAGTKSALLELGVVAEEGKGKVLVFGKGKTLVVSRNFQPSDFTPVNKAQTTSIALPKPNVRYRILSRQNLTAVQNALDHDGHVRGTLQISDPAAFWEASPYLILIEDN